ncbi:MAG: FAD-binding oxidoreductase [Flammeovirgaceae bacterium]|nr:FAD-binding oxidoreductase [Flammeovirgaceae bacterium]MDW8286618.1 FAD-dependent oxidoreductase [Flammeovirgaceae bacterium]
MKEYDYLIVGQGLAGTAMAQTLLSLNKQIAVVEQETTLATASRVSAGIFNPFTGQRLTKTWLGEILFPFLHSFYREAEQLTQTKILYDNHVYMSIDSQEKQNDFLARPQEDYDVFQVRFLTRAPYACIKDTSGGFITLVSGWLDVANYLSTFRTYLQQKNSWIKDTFLLDDIHLEAEKVLWKGRSFKKIIFCEGINAKNNPLWKWLPFKGVKGEILTVRFSENPDFTHIINRGCWILPLRNGFYKIGSTYEFHYRDELPSEAGKKEIFTKLHILTSPLM